MTYQTVAMALTLNDFEGHSPVADVFTCNPWNICAAFTRFQLTLCSHGSCGLAELLVYILISNVDKCSYSAGHNVKFIRILLIRFKL